MIHPTHTRKDLVDIIEIYEFYTNEHLKDYKEQTKKELVANLWLIVCNSEKSIPIDDKYLFFENITDIKLYLVKPSPNKRISDTLLLELNGLIKNIIYYCMKCGYEISLSNYNSLEELIIDANKVRLYGNLPNARRAIKLLNKDVKIKEDFELIMSNKIRQSILEKERVKRETIPSFKVKRGIHKVVFE
tara:strand:+ start:2636 stop:3202 length:567 start_codon:yes stop_codon:yes gene_type:complete